jgi:hypothetical protein
MNSTQVFCFACGFSYREPRPIPRKWLSLAVPILFALALLLATVVLLVPQFTGRPWRFPFEKAGAAPRVPASPGEDQAGGSEAALTPEQRELMQDCRREVALLLGDVVRLRHRVSKDRRARDSIVAAIDRAETQLEITRRMVGVLAVSADSEALTDVRSFLRDRLDRVRSRLDALGP